MLSLSVDCSDYAQRALFTVQHSVFKILVDSCKKRPRSSSTQAEEGLNHSEENIQIDAVGSWHTHVQKLDCCDSGVNHGPVRFPLSPWSREPMC